MFAGPNGSGKTTVKDGLERMPEWFGVYINPDEIERLIRQTGRISLLDYQVNPTEAHVIDFFANSSLMTAHGLDLKSILVDYREGILDVRPDEFNSYHASVLSDFLRRSLLDDRKSFSFETVMSAPDKVALLEEAQTRGFRTYLYYVATEDPEINIQRVRKRVEEGGHDVPQDKIRSRYVRSLGQLREAIRYSNRAFFFDTSEQEPWYFAEATDGVKLELKQSEIPSWFLPVWNQF
jgi:predicted ABC-type ATPase